MTKRSYRIARLFFVVTVLAVALAPTRSIAASYAEGVLNNVTVQCGEIAKINDPGRLNGLRAGYDQDQKQLRAKVAAAQAALSKASDPAGAANAKETLAGAQTDQKNMGLGLAALDRCAANRLADLAKAGITEAPKPTFNVSCTYLSPDSKNDVVTLAGVPTIQRMPKTADDVRLVLVNDNAHGGVAAQGKAYNDDPGLDLLLTINMKGRMSGGRVYSLLGTAPSAAQIDMNQIYFVTNWDGVLVSSRDSSGAERFAGNGKIFAAEEFPKMDANKNKTLTKPVVCVGSWFLP